MHFKLGHLICCMNILWIVLLVFPEFNSSLKILLFKQFWNIGSIPEQFSRQLHSKIICNFCQKTQINM